MISTLILNGEVNHLHRLSHSIEQVCPQVKVCGLSTSFFNLDEFIQEKKPQIVFVNKGNCKDTCLQGLRQLSSFQVEIILLSDEKDFAYDAISFKIGSYLLLPLKDEELYRAVAKAQSQIELKKNFSNHLTTVKHKSEVELIGIPTMDGYEFIVIKDIVRCEGLQKCTRVITKGRSDIISSYNIGEFKKKLEDYGFFSPHKSHLISLSKVRKYHKEGTITLSDQSKVPVSRRRKTDFLNQLYHL
ncbi:MAG: response regulator transcription factor [Bacteroidota bacterium]